MLLEPHFIDDTSFPVLLKLFRLFQVVGKIDDTLALLNLVSFCFHFFGNDYICSSALP